MAAAWDLRSFTEQRRIQNTLLRGTILQMALAHVPYVRASLASAGIDARLFRGLDELSRIPISMRRDITDPKRNPDGASGIVLHGTEEGVKRFSDRASLWKVAAARFFGGEEVQERAIESASRPIHVHLADGIGGRLPIAYTRDDLELLARAGARLASVVGLERDDRLLNLVPFGPTLSFWGIYYMAHGVGMTAVHARRDRRDIQAAMALYADAGTTAVAVPAHEALNFIDAAGVDRIDLSSLRTLIAVGRSLTKEERASVGAALVAAGATEARLASVYGPREGRTLWGECSVPAGRTESFGLHTYPDLDVVEVISPESLQVLPERVPGEIVITPLGFRGGGVPRWRTGDVALGGLTTEPCPNCGRTVPRVGPTVRSDAWIRAVDVAGKPRAVDLRDAGAAAAERSTEWQVEVDANGRGTHLFVHLVAGEEPAPLIDLYEDLARIGSAPAQVVVNDRGSLAARIEQAPGPWHRYWVRGEGPMIGVTER